MEYSAPVMTGTNDRKYLPTFGDLVDRLSIVLMKEIFIDREVYRKERKLIEEDIRWIMVQHDIGLSVCDLRAVLMVMLANRFIWENEGRIRSGTFDGAPSLQLSALRATHSINGVRNTAKNALSDRTNGRMEIKVDCLAADLPKEFGNWDVFDDD